jgi:hypothetical protein
MGGLSRWNWPDIKGIHDYKVQWLLFLTLSDDCSHTVHFYRATRSTRLPTQAPPRIRPARLSLSSALYVFRPSTTSHNSLTSTVSQGSSSIQIVPSLQPFASRVDNYVRGSTWIASPFASSELIKRRPDGLNYKFTEEEKKAFASDPEAYKKFRHGMESEVSYCCFDGLQEASLRWLASSIA